MGLGRHGGGVAVARWLARQGALVTITDQAAADTLAESIAALADVEIADWSLGGHHERDFASAELLVVNPAVRPDNPWVARAMASGARITSELELFLERYLGQMIGVTGSNGKSTTAAMIADILRADGRDVYLGGNIGHSLLVELDKMTPESWAVLEISSFQLAWLSPACPLPKVAVLTSFSPNHLDWHGTLEQYAAAKSRLFTRLAGGKTIVVGRDFQPLAAAAPDFAQRQDMLAEAPDDTAREHVPPLRIPGEHNRCNAALAAEAARSIGCAPPAIDKGLREFHGLPHRLELVDRVADREFYNDSMATTPESSAAALATFSARCWLLAGGYDKGVDMRPLLAALGDHACGVAFYGAVGPRLYQQARAAAPQCPPSLHETLDGAFAWSESRARGGECVVLSPGCASYDQFVDYRARGARFRALVAGLRNARQTTQAALRDARAD